MAKAKIESQTHYDLITLIERNLKIVKLIRQKYSDQTLLEASTNVEARYYRALKKDLDLAQSALNNGGLAKNVDQEQT